MIKNGWINKPIAGSPHVLSFQNAFNRWRWKTWIPHLVINFLDASRASARGSQSGRWNVLYSDFRLSVKIIWASTKYGGIKWNSQAFWILSQSLTSSGDFSHRRHSGWILLPSNQANTIKSPLPDQNECSTIYHNQSISWFFFGWRSLVDSPSSLWFIAAFLVFVSNNATVSLWTSRWNQTAFSFVWNQRKQLVCPHSLLPGLQAIRSLGHGSFTCPYVLVGHSGFPDIIALKAHRSETKRPCTFSNRF